MDSGHPPRSPGVGTPDSGPDAWPAAWSGRPPASPGDPGSPRPRPAGLVRRGLAFLVDVVAVLVLVEIGRAAGHFLARWEPVARAFFLAYVAVVPAAYVVLAHGAGGRTLGKRLVGIRVVGSAGGALGYGRALVRLLLLPCSVLPLTLGLWLALFSRDRRTLHDRLAGSRVVREPLL